METTSTVPSSFDSGLGHLAYFGLQANPFPVTPAAEMFITPAIEQIIAELTHGVLARKGFMVLTGEIGLGKTTISRKILEQLVRQGVHTALILQPYPDPLELLNAICRDFAYPCSEAGHLTTAIDTLNHALLLENKEGRNCAIIIDDSQNLNHQCLEVVRMLSNLETDDRKLVQILLVGQPELAERLKTHELRQLRSRIVIFKEVQELSCRELEDYILFRFQLAGARELSAERKAIQELHRLTQGNFRQVNLLMDRALYAAFVEESRVITRAMVREAAAELLPSAQETAEYGGLPFFRMIPTMLTMGVATGTVLFFLSRGVPFLADKLMNLSAAVESTEPAQPAKPAGEAGNFNDRLAFFRHLFAEDPWQDQAGSVQPPAGQPGQAEEGSSAAAGQDDAEKMVPSASASHASPEAERGMPEAARARENTGAASATASGAASSRQAGEVAVPAEASGGKNLVPDSVPEEITSFLDAYGLKAYAEAFLAALETKDSSRIVQRIYRETGLQMVMLHEPLPPATSEYDLLGIDDGGKGKGPGRFCLFWKPSIRFERFHEGMAGRKVTHLAELLARAGCNPEGSAPAGTEVPTLKGALLAYQEARGLPRSGFPDAATIFMLEHEDAGNGQNGGIAGCGRRAAARPLAMAPGEGMVDSRMTDP